MRAPLRPTTPSSSCPSDHSDESTISRREVSMWKVLGVALLVVVSLASVSYVRALMVPGYATWNDKTSSWVRDHGGAPLMNAYENWRYASPPPDSQPDLSQSTSPSSIPGGTMTSVGALPVLPTVAGSPAPTWTAGRTGVYATPVAYTSLYQPDPVHRSAIAGVAVLSQTRTSAHLVAGTTQPDTSAGDSAAIPGTEIPNLVAAFNSGWKMKDIAGGFYSNGVTARELRDGQASAVIDDSGHLSVVEWTNGNTVDPHIAAVRQNLALVVDHGSVVPDIASNSDMRWGSAKNQLQYTERSGLGIDASGNIVYVAASKVDLRTLAGALVDAGAVTGMELDIHGGMTEFNSWSANAAGQLGPSALLPGIQKSPDRYLAPDSRDFFYITLDSATPKQPVAKIATSATTQPVSFDSATQPATG